MSNAGDVARVAPFTRADHEGRVARLQRALVAAGLDAALYTERANFEYLTGVSLPPLWSFQRAQRSWMKRVGHFGGNL